MPECEVRGSSPLLAAVSWLFWRNVGSSGTGWLTLSLFWPLRVPLDALGDMCPVKGQWVTVRAVRGVVVAQQWQVGVGDRGATWLHCRAQNHPFFLIVDHSKSL